MSTATLLHPCILCMHMHMHMHRMPEPILSGDDVGVDEEELAVEVLVFLVSLLLQRTVHTVFEVSYLFSFFF